MDIDTMKNEIEWKTVSHLRDLYRSFDENEKQMFRKAIEMVRNETFQKISDIRQK